MIVTIHQPHFLPWIPYINKLVNSDLFIVLDDVDYRKNYFQNRTRIVDSFCRKNWLTIPVKHVHLGTPISQVQIATSSLALRTSINRLIESYHTQHEDKFLRAVISILEKPPDRLIDINMLLLELVLQELHFTNLEIKPISAIVGKMPRNKRILTALKEVQATEVIIGMGGMRNANNLSEWENEGIKLNFQYPQVTSDDCSLKFGDGVSILHDIVTFGPEKAGFIVRQFWSRQND